MKRYYVVLAVAVISNLTFASPDPQSKEVQLDSKVLAELSLAPSVQKEPILFGFGISAQFPKPIFGTLEMKLNPHFSFAAGFGGLSLDIGSLIDDSKLDGIKKNVRSLGGDVRARWHPYGGALFLGLGAGIQNWAFSAAGVDKTSGSKPIAFELTAQFNSLYLNPHLGWMWGFSKGLFVGIELGAQIPVSIWSDMDVNISDSQLQAQVQQSQGFLDSKADLEKGSQEWGMIVLPYITFFKLGYMF